MPEGWRSLLETQWGNYVELHNFPIGFIEVHENVAQPRVIISFSSLYELQKSAAYWSPSDFMGRSSRWPATHTESP